MYIFVIAIMEEIKTSINMSLIKCPECGETVSDKAPGCPHCGFVIAGNVIKCPECDSVISRDSVLCPKCAFPLPERKEEKKNEVTVQQLYSKGKEQELARIEPAFSDAKLLFEKESFIAAYNKINIALHASPNNVDCLKLEEAIVDGIRESSYKTASELFQEKQYKKALTEVESALHYAPNSHKLTVLFNEIKSAKSRRRVRRSIITVIFIFAIIGGVAYSVHNYYIQNNENEAWTEATNSATVSGLENFIELYPDGVHSMEAQQLIEELKKKDSDYWTKISSYNDVSMFKEYKEKFPEGLFLIQADNKIDSLDWAQTTQLNTTDAYSQYLNAHPQGVHKTEAETAQDIIKSATPSNEDIESMKSFFVNYYTAVEGKDDNSLLEFFEPVTARYYGIANAKKSDIQANLKKMHSKDNRQVHITINNDIFKVTKDLNGNYVVTFSIDASYDQNDATPESSSSMIVNAIVNQNQKITSITSKKSSAL